MAKPTGRPTGRPAQRELEVFDSVTAVLGAMPKQLAWWAGNAVADCAFDEDGWKKKGFEYTPPTKGATPLTGRKAQKEYVRRAHQRLKSDAADIGTQVHALLEAHAKGQTPTFPIDVAQHLEAYKAFLANEKPEIEAAECKVYSRKYGVAGTLDMIATIRGRRAVLDHKTGKGVYGEAAMQLAAYASMDFLIADPNHPNARQHTPERGRRWYEWDGPPEDEIPMPEIEAAYILHLPRKGGYKLIEVPELDTARWAWENVAMTLDKYKRETEGDLLVEVGEWEPEGR